MSSLLLLAFLIASPAGAHQTSNGTFDDVADLIFDQEGCATSGCHLPPRNAGGLNLEHDSAWAELVGFGFGEQPNNSAAQAAGKMRVDPGRPWNSYLIDKLRGHLLRGEGDPMPQRSGQWDPLSECKIREIERWILAGAPREGWVDGDEQRRSIDSCSTLQPALSQPDAPADGAQLHVASSETEPLTGHSVSFAEEVTADNAAGFITKIEIFARAGTAYLTLAFPEDDAPLMLALGDPEAQETQVDVLELPEGMGIPVAAEQTFRVSQLLLADAFDPRDPGVQAEAYVNLDISTDSTLTPLEPFVDDVGTQALFTPARAEGATGGLWPAPDGASVAALRLWTDRRAIRGVVAGTDGVLFQLDGSGQTPYAVPESPAEVLAGTGLAYTCQHDNTHLFGPKRLGCDEPASVVSGYPVPPPGVPALVDPDGATPWCNQAGDCAATEQCVPANLVGGESVDDGRCTLVGLKLAE